MSGKTRTKGTGSNLALRLGVTEEELAEAAGNTFFPKPSTPLSEQCCQTEHTPNTTSSDSPFTMGELQAALNKAKCNTAPGPDQINIPALMNLPDTEMLELLDLYNQIWEAG